MPINPEATLFERVGRWTDEVQPGQPWTRARADGYLDDIAQAITTALQAARMKAVQLSALPLFGNEFERVVTADPDGSYSLREWRGSEWARLASITDAGQFVRVAETVSFSTTLAGDGNAVPVQALAPAALASGAAYDFTIQSPDNAAYFVGYVLRPVTGDSGVVATVAAQGITCTVTAGALIFTPTIGGDGNFFFCVRRLR